MSDNERYFGLLQDLAATGVRFAVFGSAGLLLRYPATRAKHVLRDADVLLRRAELDRFAAWVTSRGGTVTAWGEPYTPGLDVTGRYYLRAHVDGLQLDATFETFLDLEEALREATNHEGVPVCPDRIIWRAKKNKDPEAARAFAFALGLDLTE